MMIQRGKPILLAVLLAFLMFSSACTANNQKIDKTITQEGPWSVLIGLRSELDGVGYKTLVINFKDGKYSAAEYDMGLIYQVADGIKLVRSYDGTSMVESKDEQNVFLDSDWSKVLWENTNQVSSSIDIQTETGVYTKLQSRETIESIYDGRIYIREDYHLSNSVGSDIIGYDITSYDLASSREFNKGISLKRLLSEEQINRVLLEVDQQELVLEQPVEKDILIRKSQLVANREAWLPGRRNGGIFVQVPVDEVVTYISSGESTKQTNHYLNVDVQLQTPESSKLVDEHLLDYLLVEQSLLGINDKHQVVVSQNNGETILYQLGVNEKIIYLQNIAPMLYKEIIENEVAIAKGSWVLKHSSYQMMNEKQLEQLSQEALQIAKAEILARHGYSFENEAIKEYFTDQSWYRQLDTPTTLNSIEESNIKAIDQAILAKSTKNIDVNFDGIVDHITLNPTDEGWTLAINEHIEPLNIPLNEQSLVIVDLDESDGAVDLLLTVYEALPQDYYTLQYQFIDNQLNFKGKLQGVFYEDENHLIWQRKFLIKPFAHFGEVRWPGNFEAYYLTSSFHDVITSFTIYMDLERSSELILEKGQAIEIIETDGNQLLKVITFDGITGYIFINEQGKLSDTDVYLRDVLSNIK